MEPVGLEDGLGMGSEERKDHDTDLFLSLKDRLELLRGRDREKTQNSSQF